MKLAAVLAAAVLAAAAALLIAAPVVSAQQGIQPPQGGQGRLRADSIRYDAKNKVLEAKGNVTLVIEDTTITSSVLVYHERTKVAWAEGDAKVVQGKTTLTAPSIKYEVTPQVTHATGGAVVTQPDLDLRAQELTYQSKEQIVLAEKDVTLTTGGSKITGPTLWANLAEKRAEVKGRARMVRKGGPPPRGRENDRVLAALAKEDTTITAQRFLKFSWAQTDEAEAAGDVAIDQVDKKARGDSAVYSEAKDRIELVGNARLDQVSGQWLIREKLADTPRTEGERQALESLAVLTADRVVITLSTRNSVATGNVKVTQVGRTATGDRGEYDDVAGKIVLTGKRARVERQDGSWLEARTVVVSLKEDTFEAFGDVDTTFTVNR